MLREYEITFITRSDLPESDFHGVLAKYEKYMTDDGGEILKKDLWGSRKLTFPINNQHRGNYAVYAKEREAAAREAAEDMGRD